MFQYLIVISPLGLLYGSAGPFLSPENLVGRSGNNFPPSAATVSGMYAAKYNYAAKQNEKEIAALRIAGPFWAYSEKPQEFFVPSPFNYLVSSKTTEIKYRLVWKTSGDKESGEWLPNKTEEIDKFRKDLEKFTKGNWMKITDWLTPKQVEKSPWKYLPHLHPRLELEQRRVVVENNREQGSLFLENAVQMNPDTCLIYLANQPLDEGWYRFGGEGHMVDVQCIQIDEFTRQRLSEPVGKCFALITPAVWGSNRFSYREPMIYQNNNWLKAWRIETLLTERPLPMRYRLGGKGKTKRLSRGRYAVPAGTVYVLEEGISQPWYEWDENDEELQGDDLNASWFPQEAYSLKRWGCGLALPLPQSL